jgi:hypothetical protein
MSKTATEAGPASPRFPKKLKKYFDDTDTETAKTIVLCPYETWRARVLKKELHNDKSKCNDP